MPLVTLRSIFDIIQKMAKKIIFFDIDQTLMNREALMNGFYETLIGKFNFSDTDIDEIKKLYKETKLEFGNFFPKVFLNNVYNSFPSVNSQLNYFFESQNLEKYLFPDSKIIEDLTIDIGIFSKGDEEYQKSKVDKFKDQINAENIFVMSEKIDKIPEVFANYSDYQIYLIDDDKEVLEAAKDFNSGIITILINRKNSAKESDRIDFIVESLFDIIPILNEKTT